jgi:3-hydroxybutyryl-CoA dehydratase
MSGPERKDPTEKHLEDFWVGERLITRGRTVDLGDLTAFAGLTGDHYPLHTDEEYAKTTRFGTRIAHGPLTFSLAVGLVGMTGFYGNAVVALIEIATLRALKPVIPGDTLHVEADVVEITPGKSDKYGELVVDYCVKNQKSEVVMTFRQRMLARRRTEK